MSNWPTKNLEDIVEFQNGLWTGKKAPFVTAPILRNTNFKNGNGSLNYDDVAEIEVEKKQLEKRTLIKGDILLERSGGGPTQPVGRVVYFEGENDRFGFSNFTTRIRVKGGDVDSKYLWFFLHSFYKSGKTELMQKKTTGIRNLTFSEYKQIEIPLPSLEVQKKIVAKLENLLAKISEAKKLRAEAQESADNLLSAELHKIFEEGKKKGWEEKELGDVVEVKTTRNTRDDLPYIGMEDVEGGNWNFLGSLEPKKVKSTTFYFDDQCLLYGKLRPYLNKVLLPDFEGHCTTEFMPIYPDKSLQREWLAWWLSSKEIVDRASATSTGSRMPRADLKQVLKFKLPVPPLAEQKKIVARLDSISQKVEAVKELQNTTETEFGALESSALSRAFSG